MKESILHRICPFLVVLATGCSSIQPTVEARPPQDGPWSALAVLPMVMLSGDDGFYEYKRTHDVLRTLWAESDWAVIEPAEFTHRDTRNRNFLQSTDLVVRAQTWGLDPRQFAVLQGAVSIREANSRAQSGAGSSATYQGEAAISFQMFTMNGVRVAEANVEVPLDPFAPHPDYDKRPEIAEAIEECVLSLVEQCEGCVRSIGHPELPLFPNLVPFFQSKDAKGVSLREVLANADPISRESMLLTQIEYFVHDVSLADAQFAASTPRGVCLAASAPPFKKHECITAVSDIPVTTPHGLARALHGKDAARVTVSGTDGMERRVVYSYSP